MSSKLSIANLASQYDFSKDNKQRRLLASTIVGFITDNEDHNIQPAPLSLKRVVEAYAEVDEPFKLDRPSKIKTIKFVRTLTGWGLKEAKEFVEDNVSRFPRESF